jgi:hypothetical protein
MTILNIGLLQMAPVSWVRLPFSVPGFRAGRGAPE